MILAEAAYYEGFKGVTAAPFFGAERRGAPVVATNRLGWEPVRTFSLVEQPNVVVVLDETLLHVTNVAAGMQTDGIIIVNTASSPEALDLSRSFNVATTNASGCAKEAGLLVAGAVISNTAILGGFARATGLISMQSLEKALLNNFKGAAAEKNVTGARLSYDATLLMKEFSLACAS
jgi:2-oxoacid:acceptor oxidoreductase gamma subunit (pyruvate/2-ketoisovalerate family)